MAEPMNPWMQRIYEYADAVAHWEAGEHGDLRANHIQMMRDELHALLKPAGAATTPLVFRAPHGVLVVYLDDGCVVSAHHCAVLEPEQEEG
jgi:hypothetical protein